MTQDMKKKKTKEKKKTLFPVILKSNVFLSPCLMVDRRYIRVIVVTTYSSSFSMLKVSDLKKIKTPIVKTYQT